MELIRVKSRLAQPYAGAFLKKEDRYVTKHHCFHFDLHVIVKNNTDKFRDLSCCNLLYICMLYIHMYKIMCGI